MGAVHIAVSSRLQTHAVNSLLLAAGCCPALMYNLDSCACGCLITVCFLSDEQTCSAGLGQAAHALLTPLSHHQLLPRQHTAVAMQMAGCHVGQGAATAAVSGSVVVVEEESTMCLRDQLIQSRCTEQR